MRRRLVGACGLAGLAALTACSSSTGASPAPVVDTPSASPSDQSVAPSDSPSAGTSPDASPSATPSASASASASASPSARPSGTPVPTSTANLTVDDALRSQLLTAFAAGKKVPAAQFIGPTAGHTYYAYLAPSKTWWAIAQFDASKTATMQTLVNLQDGGTQGVFSHKAGQPWKLTAFGGIPWPCPGDLDPALLTLWHLSTPGGCDLADDTSPALGDRSKLTFAYEPGQTPPDTTLLGLLDLYQVQLDGSGIIWLDPETVTAGGTPTNTRPLDVVELDVTKATRTEYSVGADPASSHVVDGTFDKAFAQRVTKAFKDPSVHFLVTSKKGAATLIQEIGPLTPQSADASFTEP